jgi:anti-sigma factor RsiW
MAMATHEDVNARLLELVYDELPPGERAALQAHVDGCARCQADLAAFAQVRAVARQVLDEPPPARARAAILQAAAAEAAKGPVTAAVPVPLAAAPATKPRVKEAKPSFWDQLRARWALPTLATVGAIAVFLIASRFLLEPNRAYERGKTAVAPVPTAETLDPLAPSSSSDGKAPPREEPRADVPQGLQPSVGNDAVDKDRARRRVQVERAVREGAEAKLAEKAPVSAAKPAAPAAKPHKRDLQFSGDATSGAGKGAAGGAPIEDLLNEAVRGERRGFAPPPPAREADGVGSVGGAKKKSAADEAGDDFARPAPAPAPAAAPRAKREEESLSKEADSAPMAAEAEESEGAAQDKSTKTKSRPASAPAPSAGPSPMVQRADQLFAQGQWSAAALAYRALLSRDPRNADAPRWRQRLQVAEHQVEAAKAAAKATKGKPADDSAP